MQIMFNLDREKLQTEINNEKGFSIIELLIVVLIIAILTVSSVIVFGSKNLFHADHQAYLLMDAFKEARQRAITQQETLRVEVSKTKREIRIINENNAGDASDDVLIKRYLLADPKDLTFDISPTNIVNTPQEPTPVPPADFKASVHPLSQNENVATLRFLQNGNVTNAGSNAIGDNSVVTGATFYFFTPVIDEDGTITNEGLVIRAITILGSSGNSGYWKCPVDNNQCSVWKR